MMGDEKAVYAEFRECAIIVVLSKRYALHTIVNVIRIPFYSCTVHFLMDKSVHTCNCKKNKTTLNVVNKCFS